jgi:hypothetical protein
MDGSPRFRVPPGEHDPSAWSQNASAFDQCCDGRVGELDRVNAHDRFDRRIVEAGGLEISEAELVPGDKVASVFVSLRPREGDGGDVDADETGPLRRATSKP